MHKQRKICTKIICKDSDIRKSVYRKEELFKLRGRSSGRRFRQRKTYGSLLWEEADTQWKIEFGTQENMVLSYEWSVLLYGSAEKWTLKNMEAFFGLWTLRLVEIIKCLQNLSSEKVLNRVKE